MCSFADGFSMFDVTPVENLFIEEYMLRASGDFVKVYIYGLRLCYHPVEGATVPTIARALGMEEKTVLEAFIYWERVGVLRRVADNPPAYSFFNLKQAMLNRKPEGDIPKADRDFNIALQDLFGTRLLQAQDYERVYKIIEELGMAPEVVLLLVKHCIECSGRGTAVTFASIEKEAARWAKASHAALLRQNALGYNVCAASDLLESVVGADALGPDAAPGAYVRDDPAFLDPYVSDGLLLPGQGRPARARHL